MEERLGQARARFAQAANLSVRKRREALDSLDRLRRTLGYTETLGRGYAVIRAGEDVLTSKAAASAHAAMEIQFSDGRLGVTPTGATPKAVKKAPKAKLPKDQGSLF